MMISSSLYQDRKLDDLFERPRQKSFVETNAASCLKAKLPISIEKTKSNQPTSLQIDTHCTSSLSPKKQVSWAENIQQRTSIKISRVPSVRHWFENERGSVQKIAKEENFSFLPIQGRHIDLMNGKFEIDSSIKMLHSNSDLFKAIPTSFPWDDEAICFDLCERFKKPKTDQDTVPVNSHIVTNLGGDEEIDHYFAPIHKHPNLLGENILYQEKEEEVTEAVPSTPNTFVEGVNLKTSEQLESDSSQSSCSQDEEFDDDEIFFFHLPMEEYQRKCYKGEARSLNPSPICLSQKSILKALECREKPSYVISGGRAKFLLIRREKLTEENDSMLSTNQKGNLQKEVDCSEYLQGDTFVAIENGTIRTRLQATISSRECLFFLRVFITYEHPITKKIKTQTINSSDFTIGCNSKIRRTPKRLLNQIRI